MDALGSVDGKCYDLIVELRDEHQSSALVDIFSLDSQNRSKIKGHRWFTTKRYAAQYAMRRKIGSRDFNLLALYDLVHLGHVYPVAMASEIKLENLYLIGADFQKNVGLIESGCF